MNGYGIKNGVADVVLVEDLGELVTILWEWFCDADGVLMKNVAWGDSWRYDAGDSL